MPKKFDVLEYLAKEVGCTYISDLRTQPYNHLAKKELEKPNFPLISNIQRKELNSYLSIAL